jgi:thioredoxin reductase (NADPH)
MSEQEQQMNEPLGFGMEEPRNRNGAFPRLSDDLLDRFREVGELLEVSSGDVLFRAGDDGYDFYVVISGAVAIVEGYARENRVIAVHGERRFLGEINLLIGAPPYLTAVVRDDGEVLRVPLAELRRLVSNDDELSNLVLRAYMSRRSILIEAGAGIRLIGSRYSQDANRLREFLTRNRMPFHWIDLEEDEEADRVLQALDITPCETPVVIGASRILKNPGNGELGSVLGLGARGPAPAMCDVVIIGGGPAGLAAAVYGASEGLDTQAIDSIAFGGQASTSSRIENYLGFPTGVSGSELAERAQLQARRFGARLVVPAEAVGIERQNNHFAVALADGSSVHGRTVVVATGARYRKLDIPSLPQFEGNGVYYAATISEAQLCSGDPVVVVGGGNSAGQAAMFLSQHSVSCHLLIRGGDLGKSMSRYLIDEIERNDRVHVDTYSEVVELRGERGLEEIVTRDTRTGERHEVLAKGLFVFIGAAPHTDWLRGFVAMDDHCFLLTGRDVKGEDAAPYNGDRPYFLETSQPGMFAVGDVHSGSIKRCASAVGEGSMAIQLVHQRLAAPLGAKEVV